MNYSLEIKKFIYSQYVYTGLRITAGVVIPGFILYQFNLLSTMIAVPLGAIFIALTDNPGPRHHRLNGMTAAIIINGIIVLIAGLSQPYPILIGIELIVLSIASSLVAVYGDRSNGIGLIALIVFVLNITPVTGANSFYTALYLTAGGSWYTFLSLVSNTIRPYQPVQQLLGECLLEAGDYLKGKALFYDKDFDGDAIVLHLMEQQVKIHEQQDELRSIIFKTRKFLHDSTNTGRRLTMIFLDSLDLFERIMTTQQDYRQLHHALDDETTILKQYQQHIILMANALHETGLAVQAGYAYNNAARLDTSLQDCKDAFALLRKQKLQSANIEIFIKLRHILNSLDDLTERIERIETYTNFRQKINRQLTKEEVQPFVQPSNFDVHLLLSNISLKSAHFRHALRLAIALTIGYLVTQFFSLGHGYWILLTIATIVKPAYSISRKKNIQRVAGTLIGVAMGFITLHFTQNNTVIFMVMLFGMMVAYIFLRLQYLVSTAGITLYVILNFHFLYPSGLGDVLTDRLLDTIIGSAIAFTCSYFILPAWEHKQINNLLADAMKANANYFTVTAEVFTGKKLELLGYKLARKEAFVAIANLSGALQRMLTEPKSRQQHLEHYHQLVTTSHMLTSYIASLSYYAQQFGEQYSSCDFEPMIKQVKRQFDYALMLLEKQDTEASLPKFPVHKKVQQLLQQRRKELETGVENRDAGTGKKLSEMKTITDQFQLVSSIVEDEIKVLKELNQETLTTIKQPDLLV